MSRPAPGYRNENAGDMEYGAVQDNADQALLTAFGQSHDPNGGQMPQGTASDTAAAALSHYQMADQSFQSQGSTGDAPYGDATYIDHQLKENSPSQQGQGPVSGHSPSGNTPGKPTVGSDEWHKVRRDNHKEVERRRRETINEGINELAKIVPGCEKNKGSILQRAVQYIGQLKDAEGTNLEKWTLEKLLLDQAINELSTTCDRLKADYQRAWDEKEVYKRACDSSGIVPDELKDRDDSGGVE
ncbi:hypothetical protein EG328_004598 [Venturia inaequalis]|nr:hypothetical protein EG328_004598 [Venturia inaequalis]